MTADRVDGGQSGGSIPRSIAPGHDTMMPIIRVAGNRADYAFALPIAPRVTRGIVGNGRAAGWNALSRTDLLPDTKRSRWEFAQQ